MPSKTFVNEKGNEITVSGKRLSKNMINFKLKGPKSTSDQTITVQEAKELKSILNKLIT